MVDFFAFSKEARQLVYDELNAIDRSKMRAVSRQFREEIDSNRYVVEKLEWCQELVRELPLNLDVPSTGNVSCVKFTARDFEFHLTFSNFEQPTTKKVEKLSNGEVISTKTLDDEHNVHYWAQHWLLEILQQKGWHFEMVDLMTIIFPEPTASTSICPVSRLQLTQSPYSQDNRTIRKWLDLFAAPPLSHLTIRSEHYYSAGIGDSELVCRVATLRVVGDTDLREWTQCAAGDLRLVDPRPPNDECLQLLEKMFEKFMEQKEDFTFKYTGRNWDSLNGEKLIKIIQGLKKSVFLNRSATSYRLIDTIKNSKFMLSIHYQHDYSG